MTKNNKSGQEIYSRITIRLISVNEQRALRRETFSIPDWTIGDLTTEVEEVGSPQRTGKEFERIGALADTSAIHG